MAIQIQLRQGTTTEHNTFTGAVGEVTVDTTKDTLVVHDGKTVGGHPVATRANADGTISLIKKDGTSGGTINSGGLFNNTLTSTNTNQALTASQGMVLKDLVDRYKSPLTDHLLQRFRKDIDGYLTVDPKILYSTDVERVSLIVSLKKMRESVPSSIIKEKYNPLINMLTDTGKQDLKDEDIGLY